MSIANAHCLVGSLVNFSLQYGLYLIKSQTYIIISSSNLGAFYIYVFQLSMLCLLRISAYVERTPHEIYIPNYGIGLRPQDETASWNHGIRLETGPEYPLHFTVGMTGCAFSIILDQYFKYGDEAGNSLFNELGKYA